MKSTFSRAFYFKSLNILYYGTVAFFCGCSKNNRVIKKIQERAFSKIGKALNWDIKITSLRMTKHKYISIEQVTLQVSKGVKLTISNLKCTISLKGFFKGDLITRIDANCIRFSFPASTSMRKDNIQQMKAQEYFYKIFQRRTFRRIFYILNSGIKFCPSCIDIKCIEWTWFQCREEILARISGFILQNSLFTFNIESQAFIRRIISVKGHFDKEKKSFLLEDTASFGISSDTSQLIFIKNNSSLSYKTIKAEVQILSRKSILFNLSLKGLGLYCPKLLRENIEIETLGINLNLKLSNRLFQITKNSEISYNNVCLTPVIIYYFPNLIKLTLSSTNLSIANITDSYRYFIYKPLYDFIFGGKCSLVKLIFAFETTKPYKYYFNHEASWDEIKVLKVPDKWPDLSKPFTHSIYENGDLIKQIYLSEQNKNFIPLNEIPNILQEIILFCEDPKFYLHKGVDDGFIGRAIVQDILNKCMVRGGSTITMQVVRNLFLGHEKTIGRKIEEILISLLIENVFQITKSRILELYFNIIEFGPSIYGLKEACRFYFSKTPGELSILEIMILSYIIPRPKYFLDAFLSSSEQLKRNLKYRIQILSKVFINRNIISQNDIDSLGMNVCVKGRKLNLS